MFIEPRGLSRINSARSKASLSISRAVSPKVRWFYKYLAPNGAKSCSVVACLVTLPLSKGEKESFRKPLREVINLLHATEKIDSDRAIFSGRTIELFDQISRGYGLGKRPTRCFAPPDG